MLNLSEAMERFSVAEMSINGCSRSLEMTQFNSSYVWICIRILYFNYGLLSEINMDGWMDGWIRVPQQLYTLYCFSDAARHWSNTAHFFVTHLYLSNLSTQWWSHWNRPVRISVRQWKWSDTNDEWSVISCFNTTLSTYKRDRDQMDRIATPDSHAMCHAVKINKCE